MRQIQFENGEAIRELQAAVFPIRAEDLRSDFFTGWLIDDHVFAGQRTVDGQEEMWRVSLFPWGIALCPFLDCEDSAIEYAREVSAMKFDWPRLLALPDALNNPEYRDVVRTLSDLFEARYSWDDMADHCAPPDLAETSGRA